MDKKEIIELYNINKQELTVWCLSLFPIGVGSLLISWLVTDFLLCKFLGIEFLGIYGLLIAAIVPWLLYKCYKKLYEKLISRWCAKRLGVSYEELMVVVKEDQERAAAEAEKRRMVEEGNNRFVQDGSIYLAPFLYRLSQLNVGGRKEQEAFLVEKYSEEVLPYIFKEEHTDEEMNGAFLYWRKQELQDRRKMVDLLFKFTVLEDGIRNNEWNLLIQWMIDLRFNNNYIEYFKKRYAPLRTEFDAYQRSSGASATSHSLSYLKPYYAELGLQEGATEEEIKRAYHSLAMQHHPDLPKNAGRMKECEAMMAKINLAYEKVMG